MIAVIRQRNISLLWSAGLISLIGDWTLSVALPFYVFALTGSALATGLIFMARTLPGVLFGGIAGVFVDRWDRKRTMILSCWLQVWPELPINISFRLHKQDIYHMTDADRKAAGIASLPGSLNDAILLTEGSKLVREALGDHVFKAFISNKKTEWDAYRMNVTQWELDRYLPLL